MLDQSDIDELIIDCEIFVNMDLRVYSAWVANEDARKLFAKIITTANRIPNLAKLIYQQYGYGPVHRPDVINPLINKWITGELDTLSGVQAISYVLRINEIVAAIQEYGYDVACLQLRITGLANTIAGCLSTIKWFEAIIDKAYDARGVAHGELLTTNALEFKYEDE